MQKQKHKLRSMLSWYQIVICNIGIGKASAHGKLTCSLCLQDIRSFVLLSKAQCIFAMKDLVGGKALEGPQPHQKATAAINVSIVKVASWLSSTSVYILSGLIANLKELAQVIDKRSSEDDAIKASQVSILCKTYFALEQECTIISKKCEVCCISAREKIRVRFKVRIILLQASLSQRGMIYLIFLRDSICKY